MAQKGYEPSVGISVVIPTTQKHHKWLLSAVGSVDYRPAEVLIVNDSPAPVPANLFEDFPKDMPVVVLERDNPEKAMGAGRARNKGADNAFYDAILFLDADDYLLPNAIRNLAVVYEACNGNYIVYGNVIRMVKRNGKPITDMYVSKKQCCYPSKDSSLVKPNRPYCCLIPKWAHVAVGGVDVTLETYEDVFYEKQLDAYGVCAVKIKKPIYVYRYEEGTRRLDAKNPDRLRRVKNRMYNRLYDYYQEKTVMGCSTCPGSAKGRATQAVPPTQAVQEIVQKLPNSSSRETTEAVSPATIGEQELYMEYTGLEPTKWFIGPVTNLRYRFGKGNRASKKRIVNKGEATDTEVEIDFNDAARLVDINFHGVNQFKVVDLIGVDRTVKEPAERRTGSAKPTASPEVGPIERIRYGNEQPTTVPRVVPPQTPLSQRATRQSPRTDQPVRKAPPPYVPQGVERENVSRSPGMSSAPPPVRGEAKPVHTKEEVEKAVELARFAYGESVAEQEPKGEVLKQEPVSLETIQAPKHVSEMTVAELKEAVSLLDNDELKYMWLVQEQESPKPRKTVLKILGD